MGGGGGCRRGGGGLRSRVASSLYVCTSQFRSESLVTARKHQHLTLLPLSARAAEARVGGDADAEEGGRPWVVGAVGSRWGVGCTHRWQSRCMRAPRTLVTAVRRQQHLTLMPFSATAAAARVGVDAEKEEGERTRAARAKTERQVVGSRS